MSSTRARWGGALAALVVSFAACCPPPVEVSPPKPRLVKARLIPVPTTMSPELQMQSAHPIGRLATPQGAAAWRALQKEQDEVAVRTVRTWMVRLGTTVTPTTVGGVKASLVSPSEVAPENRRRLLVHLHGGAYLFGAGEAGLDEALLVAHTSKTPVLSIDYRMPPDHPFPAALDDAVAAWKGVLADHDPARTALFGTSAGGGLTMATVVRLRDLQLLLPGALFLGTPWTDLSKTGDTYFTNAGLDIHLDAYDGGIEGAARAYAAGRPLTDPLISPVYADVHGFPPTLLFSGTRDLLLSCTVRAHRKLRQAGAEADLHVFEGQSHAQYESSYPSPESKEALAEIARFFDRHLKR